MVWPGQSGWISGKYLSKLRPQYSLNIMKVDGEVDEDCQLMSMSELSYVERVKNIQRRKYPEKPEGIRETGK